MELAEEAKRLPLLCFVRVLQEPRWVIQPAIIYKTATAENDVVSYKIPQFTYLIKFKARKPTVLKIRSKTTEEC